MTDLDAVTLEILRTQLESVAEEMGYVLIRGAYSPNIKERRDCSTALFDADGRMVAQAEHIPVHLGAMPAAVAAVRERDPEPGDVYLLNDPFTGGTHLPDITLVSPLAPDGDVVGYAVSRAHHADVGGGTPGSMPAGAREIYEEGLRLPPVRLVAGGEVVEDVRSLVLANVRNPRERRADLRAQLAANERAEDRLADLRAEHGPALVDAAFDAVIDYSRDRLEAELDALPDGTYRARDALEGDGITDDEIPVAVALTVDGGALDVDFAGTAAQVPGNVNAPRSVAESAVYFAVRCVTDPDIPPNQGCYDPVSVSVPEGSLLDPHPPAAVVGGNVETSQRVADVVFAAFAEAAPDRVPAQGQGTMNNLIIGGRAGREARPTGAPRNGRAGSEATRGQARNHVPRNGRAGSEATREQRDANGSECLEQSERGGTTREQSGFTYYETVGGGFGARPSKDGMDGVQVGMTNTLNTPVEALEASYPMRVERYALRPDSGGAGEFRGGLGLVRAITVEVDATVSLLTERRRLAPRGVAGGADGATGRNLVDGETVPAKTTRGIDAGTTVTLLTPGGGGYGDPGDRDSAAAARDREEGYVTGSDAENR